MDRFLGRFSPQIYALMRIMVGALFLLHGTQKLFSFPPRPYPAFAPGSLPFIAGVLELVCGALILIGLFTSFAAFIASGLMAVAYFMAHAKDGFFPIVNKGELSVIYCFVFLFIASYGSGIWSVDAARGKGHRK